MPCLSGISKPGTDLLEVLTAPIRMTIIVQPPSLVAMSIDIARRCKVAEVSRVGPILGSFGADFTPWNSFGSFQRTVVHYHAVGAVGHQWYLPLTSLAQAPLVSSRIARYAKIPDSSFGGCPACRNWLVDLNSPIVHSLYPQHHFSQTATPPITAASRSLRDDQAPCFDASPVCSLRVCSWTSLSPFRPSRLLSLERHQSRALHAFLTIVMATDNVRGVEPRVEPSTILPHTLLFKPLDNRI